MSSFDGLRQALELVSNEGDRQRLRDKIKELAWRSGHSEDCHYVLYGDWCECFGPPRVPDCPHVAPYEICMECGGMKRDW